MVKKLKEQVFISLVLYARNQGEIIGNSLEKLWNLLDNKFENFEIIIVNDASEDDSEKKIKEFSTSKKQRKITLINLEFKHGLEDAINVGTKFSIGDFVIELDSPQLHFDENILFQLYEKSCEGYDVVSLAPKTKKKFSSILFYKLLNKFSDIELEFETQIAHIITRRAINSISKIKDKIRYRKVLLAFSGYKKAALTIKLDKPITTSYDFFEKVKMASDILFSFTNLGMRINIYIALLFFCFSIFLGVYALYEYITYEEVMEGWTTLMLFLSFGFSGIFVTLAIINKYFSIALREIRTLPEYIIKNIEKL